MSESRVLELESKLNQQLVKLKDTIPHGIAVPQDVKETLFKLLSSWGDETEKNSHLCECLLPQTPWGRVFAPLKENEFNLEDEFIKQILTILNDTVIKTGRLKLNLSVRRLLTAESSYKDKEKDFRLAHLNNLYPQFFSALTRQWIFYPSRKSYKKSKELWDETWECRVQGQFTKAEKLLRQAQQLDSSYANHYLIDLLVDTNQWEKCLELLSGLDLDEHPSSPYRGLRGKIYLLQKEFALAEKDFLSFHDGSNYYVPELIACYLGQGKTAEALKIYKEQVKRLNADRQLQCYLYLKSKDAITEEELHWEARATASHLIEQSKKNGVSTDEAVLAAMVTRNGQDFFSALNKLSYSYFRLFDLTMFNFIDSLMSANSWEFAKEISSFKFLDLKQSKIHLLNVLIYERDTKVRQIALLQALMPHTLLGAFFSLGHVRGVQPSGKVLAALENELANHPLDHAARDFLHSQMQTLQAYPQFLKAITQIIEKERKYNGGAAYPGAVQDEKLVAKDDSSEQISSVTQEKFKIVSYGALRFFEVYDARGKVAKRIAETIATEKGRIANPDADPYRKKVKSTN